MRLAFIITLVSGFLTTGNPTLNESFPDFEKKIQKMVQKHWKDIEVDISVPKLDQQNNRVLEGRNVYVISNSDTTLGFLVVSKALGCLIGGCDSQSASDNERLDSSYEKFYYAVLYNTNFSIELVKVLQYESDFGYEICGRRWLKQFAGYEGCDLEYGKQIDGITGATVSVKSITSDINNLCWILSDIKDELLNSQ